MSEYDLGEREQIRVLDGRARISLTSDGVDTSVCSVARHADDNTPASVSVIRCAVTVDFVSLKVLQISDLFECVYVSMWCIAHSCGPSLSD